MKFILNESQYKIYKKYLKENNSRYEGLTPSQVKLVKILDAVQKGYLNWDDFEEFYGGFELLVKKLSDENLLKYMNPFDPMWEDNQNMVFYVFYENNTSFIWEIVKKYLSDVIEENGKYYVKADADDLSGYFNTSYRDEISREGIESIISGEHNYDPFYDVSDNVYRDVYDDLTHENQQKVKQTIKNDLLELKQMDVNSRTPVLFDEIANEQGHEDYIELTPEIIDRLLDDENCIEYIILEESNEVNQDLYSLYSGCYDSVIKDSWYYDIMKELEGYVIDDSKRLDYTYEKLTYDKEGNPQKKKAYGDKYEATNCIYDVVSEWLSENKDTNRHSVEYFGTYKGLLQSLVDDGVRDSLRVPRLDEYPSHREVIKCVNESIGDYF